MTIVSLPVINRRDEEKYEKFECMMKQDESFENIMFEIGLTQIELLKYLKYYKRKKENVCINLLS